MPAGRTALTMVLGVGLCVSWAAAQPAPAQPAPPEEAAPPKATAVPTEPAPEPAPTPSDPFLNMEAPKIFSRSVNVEGFGAVKYLACQPAHMAPGESYPLILALPAGDGSEKMARAGLELYWARPGVSRGYLVVALIAQKEAPFNRSGADMVVPFLKAVLNELPVNSKMVFLAGVSNGGVGALRVALDDPKLFCGLIGIPMSYRDPKWLEEIHKLTGIPVFMRVGSEDELGFKPASEKLAEKMREQKVSVNDGVLKGQGSGLNVDLSEMFGWMDDVKKAVLARDVQHPLRSIVIPTAVPTGKAASRPAKLPTTRPALNDRP